MFCDLLAPVAQPRPLIERDQDGGFMFNSPLSFDVPREHSCRAGGMLVFSWARADREVRGERREGEDAPPSYADSGAKEDDGLSDVLSVFAADDTEDGPGSGIAVNNGRKPGSDVEARLDAEPTVRQAEPDDTASTTGLPSTTRGADAAPRRYARPDGSGAAPGRDEARIHVPLDTGGNERVAGVTAGDGRGGAPGRDHDRGGDDAHTTLHPRRGRCRGRSWVLDVLISTLQILTVAAMLYILLRLPVTQGSRPVNSWTDREDLTPTWPGAPMGAGAIEGDQLYTIEETRRRQQKEAEEEQKRQRQSRETKGPHRTARATMETDALLFNAYDCSMPVDVTSLTTRAAPICKAGKPTTTMPTRQYSVLQHVPYIRFPVTRCRMVRTQIWHHCGMHSHSAIMPLEWTVEQEVYVSPQECQTAWDNKQIEFRTTKGTVTHALRLNDTTYLRTEVAGRTKSDMTCKGEPVKWHQMQNYEPWKPTGFGMVGYEHTKVSLHRTWATADPSGVVTVQEDQLQLPCPLREEGCITNRGLVFSWDKPTEKERCPFFLARDVDGVEVPDEDGKPVFISTDGSMLRLNKGAPQSQCGGLVYGTQFSKLFLAPRGPQVVVIDAFRRPIHPAAMSPTTYANQQDSFIFHKLIEEMNTRFQLAQKARCMEAQVKATAEYARRAAEQHAIMDGETVHLGSGQFVTASGEVWYHYQCYPLKVRAREADGCYGSLPVTLSKVDYDRYRKARRRPNVTDADPERAKPTVFTAKDNAFFLEPRTHRLTTVAVPSKCVTPFVPLYENVYGEWIAYDSKAFSRAPHPGTIEGTAWKLNRPPPTAETRLRGRRPVHQRADRKDGLLPPDPDGREGTARHHCV